MGLQDRTQKVLRGELPGGVPQSKYRVETKTANYTCVDGDSGTIFNNIGAGGSVTFTLPAVTLTGWYAYFFNGVLAQEIVVASAGSLDNIIGFNDIAADSVAYTTASEHAGGGFLLISSTTLWMAFAMSYGLGLTAQTVTTT